MKCKAHSSDAVWTCKDKPKFRRNKTDFNALITLRSFGFQSGLVQ